MTLYTQPRAEVFASSAPPSEIQPFEAWLRGLGIAFDETNGYPEMTGLNGLFNALNLYIKYLEQNGFAEWRSDMEYPQGAGVRVGLVWYRAKLQNTNKPPATSQTEWELFLNASALSYQEPLYIDGNTIKIRDASPTVKGVTQFASATEVATRANVSKAINPANVAQMFIGGGNTNDYLELPNGMIIQWMVGNSDANGNLVLQNPKPFKTSPIGGMANEGSPTGWGINSVTVWAFDLGNSNKTQSLARVREIRGTNAPTPAVGFSGRILVWGF